MQGKQVNADSPDISAHRRAEKEPEDPKRGQQQAEYSIINNTYCSSDDISLQGYV
jgi:hypothetical protein